MTTHFPGYCLACKAWGTRRRIAASLETPITPAASTTIEPPITGMLIQSDEGEVVPANSAHWLYSVTKREPSREEFLIDSGAATSVCQQSLADSLGGKPRGHGVELKSATGHQFTTTGNTTICLRTRDGINVRATFRLRPRTLVCRDLPHRLDKCATEAISSRSTARVHWQPHWV